MINFDLHQLRAFIAIAEHKSFRAASRLLGVSPSALSHSMRALEEHLGVRLLNRTTRSVSPTEAGKRLLNRVRPLITDLNDAVTEITTEGIRPSGSLRITAPESGAALLLRNVLPKFSADYPDIQVEVIADGRMMDIVADGFDAGVRLQEMVPKDMIAVRLGPKTRAIIVASPGYMVGRSPPECPQDIQKHHCIRLRFDGGRLYRWDLEYNGRPTKLSVPGPITLNKVELAVEAALAGNGIAFVPEHLVIEHIAAERLVQFLDDWTSPMDGYCLYYPANRHPPTALRLFSEAVREWTRNTPTARLV